MRSERLDHAHAGTRHSTTGELNDLSLTHNPPLQSVVVFVTLTTRPVASGLPHCAGVTVTCLLPSGLSDPHTRWRQSPTLAARIALAVSLGFDRNPMMPSVTAMAVMMRAAKPA